MKHYNKKQKKDSFMTVIKNWTISIILTGAMIFGLQCYSGTNNLKFAQISDSHFFTGNTNTTYKMTAESSKLLDDAIEQINETPDISFVMFTGDLIDKPYEKELNEFLLHTEEVKYPWYFSFGNHDTMIGGYLEPKLFMQLVNKYNKNSFKSKILYIFQLQLSSESLSLLFKQQKK